MADLDADADEHTRRALRFVWERVWRMRESMRRLEGKLDKPAPVAAAANATARAGAPVATKDDWYRNRALELMAAMQKLILDKQPIPDAIRAEFEELMEYELFGGDMETP